MKTYTVRYMILDKVYEVSFATKQAAEFAVARILKAGRKVISVVEFDEDKGTYLIQKKS